MSEMKTTEERLAALESDIAWLVPAYKDVAWTYLNDLVKRIEDIRSEVLNRLSEAEAGSRNADVKIMSAIDDGIKKLEAARDRVHGEVLQNVKEEVLSSLNDGSHGLITVAGKPHPILARVK
jgi:hypothetical protein